MRYLGYSPFGRPATGDIRSILSACRTDIGHWALFCGLFPKRGRHSAQRMPARPKTKALGLTGPDAIVADDFCGHGQRIDWPYQCIFQVPGEYLNRLFTIRFGDNIGLRALSVDQSNHVSRNCHAIPLPQTLAQSGARVTGPGNAFRSAGCMRDTSRLLIGAVTQSSCEKPKPEPIFISGLRETEPRAAIVTIAIFRMMLCDTRRCVSVPLPMAIQLRSSQGGRAHRGGNRTHFSARPRRIPSPFAMPSITGAACLMRAHLAFGKLQARPIFCPLAWLRMVRFWRSTCDVENVLRIRSYR